LQKKNLEFLEDIDADYFSYVAELNAARIEDADDKHRAALSLRLAYSQGLGLLAFLLRFGNIRSVAIRFRRNGSKTGRARGFHPKKWLTTPGW
jgi:hypothetical protein